MLASSQNETNFSEQTPQLVTC